MCLPATPFAAIRSGRIAVVRGELRGFSAQGPLVARRVVGAASPDEWAPEQPESYQAVVLCTGACASLFPCTGQPISSASPVAC